MNLAQTKLQSRGLGLQATSLRIKKNQRRLVCPVRATIEPVEVNICVFLSCTFSHMVCHLYLPFYPQTFPLKHPYYH